MDLLRHEPRFEDAADVVREQATELGPDLRDVSVEGLRRDGEAGVGEQEARHGLKAPVDLLPHLRGQKVTVGACM